MALPPRQQRFVDEYLIDLNATQAAIRAGYSPKTAGQQASRLLKNVKVATAIAAGHTAKARRVEVSADWVLARLVDNAEQAVAAEHPNWNAANRALELIGKHLGMFIERAELTGKDGGPITTEDLTDYRSELLDRIRRFADRSRTGPLSRGTVAN